MRSRSARPCARTRRPHSTRNALRAAAVRAGCACLRPLGVLPVPCVRLTGRCAVPALRSRPGHGSTRARGARLGAVGRVGQCPAGRLLQRPGLAVRAARALELRCAPQGGRDACGHAHLAGACAGGRRRLHGAKVYTTAWREGLQWRRHFVAQVISEALQKRGLSCIPIGSTEAAGGKHPREFHASVCVQTRRGARSPSFHMDVHILTGRHSR